MSDADTNVKPAAALKVKAMAVPLTCIVQKAGWSRETTFAKYYDKQIATNSDLFQNALLE